MRRSALVPSSDTHRRPARLRRAGALCALSLLALMASGCVVAPAPPPRAVVVAPPPVPVMVVPPAPPPVGVVYVAPSHPAPGPGWAWHHHPRYGWGYWNPGRGWHRGW